MTSYTRGQRAQYKARDQLILYGFEVMIGARSLGPFDLIAWNKDKVRFIQVKSIRADKKYFDKKELQKIMAEEIPPNASKEIWIWIANQGWRHWIPDPNIKGSWVLIYSSPTMFNVKSSYPRPF